MRDVFLDGVWWVIAGVFVFAYTQNITNYVSTGFVTCYSSSHVLYRGYAEKIRAHGALFQFVDKESGERVEVIGNCVIKGIRHSDGQ